MRGTKQKNILSTSQTTLAIFEHFSFMDISETSIQGNNKDTIEENRQRVCQRTSWLHLSKVYARSVRQVLQLSITVFYLNKHFLFSICTNAVQNSRLCTRKYCGKVCFDCTVVSGHYVQPVTKPHVFACQCKIGHHISTEHISNKNAIFILNSSSNIENALVESCLLSIDAMIVVQT